MLFPTIPRKRSIRPGKTARRVKVATDDDANGAIVAVDTQPPVGDATRPHEVISLAAWRSLGFYFFYFDKD